MLLFQTGYNPEVMPARLTLDPVFATQRPLYFYIAIAALNWATHLFMRYALGFSRLRKYDSPSQYVYHRAAKSGLPSHRHSVGAQVPDKAAHKKQPIVFVHGIGIGFVHYLGMIMSFPTDTDVFLVEWPHVGNSPNSACIICCKLLCIEYRRMLLQ